MLRFLPLKLFLLFSVFLCFASTLIAGDAPSFNEINQNANHEPVDAVPFTSGSLLNTSYETKYGLSNAQLLQQQQQEQQNQQTQQDAQFGIVDVFSRLNIRKGPGVEYGIVGKLYPGDRLCILELDMGWYRIDWNGRKDVWVCGYYVRKPGERFRNPAAANAAGWTSGEATQAVGWAPDRNNTLGPGRYVPAMNSGVPGRYVQAESQAQQFPVPARDAKSGTSVVNVPFISQMNSGGKYPSGYCGPTAVKMVMDYYGKNVNIDTIALKAVNGRSRPMYRKGEGSSSDEMVHVLRANGFTNTYKQPNRSIAWLKEQTAAGRPVIVGVKGRYHPTRKSDFGHFLVVIGVTDSGDVIINDPGTRNGKHLVCPAKTFNAAWSNRWRYGIVAC